MNTSKINKQEEAVSPVIGVILMVAITVILAAVIAAFTFGMATNIQKTRMISGTVVLVDTNTVVVTYNGGQDQTTCVGVRWDLTRADGTTITQYQMGTTVALGSLLEVGTSKTFVTNYSGRKHIFATAYFNDGTQQIILDTYV